ALGIGYGLSSLLAGLPVWHSGSAAQQARLAARLLAGDAVSVCFHERQHGSDVLGNEFRARRQGASYLLSGEKWLINNIGRASAATVFARTRDGNTPRSHSLFFVEQDTLERGRVLARIKTVGIRGCALAGWAADDVPLDAEALVGAEGGGFEITAKAFQLSRAVLPGMAIGIVDSALRLCHDFLSRRRLYRVRAIDIPLVRRTLQTCFLDIVAADCLALAAARMAHAMPGQLGLASAIAKLWIPRTLDGTMKSLAVLLGARHYLRGGEYGGFQKLLRDFPVSYLVHTSAGVRQSLPIQQ